MHDPSIVTVNGKRFIRLDGKNQPTGDSNRSTGVGLVDLDVHAGGETRISPFAWLQFVTWAAGYERCAAEKGKK